jgi:hypothetical protein
MTIKVSLLKSGEDVIADIQEMIVDEKSVGYIFKNPCLVKLISTSSSSSDKHFRSPCSLQVTPWMPLTNDPNILVPLDWVVTIVEPIPELKEIYENRVLRYGNENDKDPSTVEQYDSHQSD